MKWRPAASEEQVRGRGLRGPRSGLWIFTLSELGALGGPGREKGQELI